MKAMIAHPRCRLAATILAIEALILVIGYRFGPGAPAALSPSEGVCRFLGGGAPLCAALPAFVAISAMIVVAVAVILFARGRIDLAASAAAIETARRPKVFLALNAAGVAALCAPWLLLAADMPATASSRAGVFWTFGAVLAVAGFALWLAEPRDLRSWIGPAVGLVFVAPAVIIFASFGAEGYLWASDWVRDLTFSSTSALLLLLGQSTELHGADLMIIGVGGFAAEIAEACSGVAGMAMVSLVVFLYGLASRQRLRTGRVLALIPLAILLSWAVNIVRISAIMLIGAHASPDLALNAFHSYAGWIVFTVLSAGLILLAETAPWFRRDGQAPARPATGLLADRAAAEILPFVLFLTSGLVVSASFTMPAAGYPVVAMVAGLSIAAFRPFYSRLVQRIDPPSIMAGLLVGGVWLWGHRGGAPLPVAEILGAAAPATVGLWIATRLLGTVLFVPLIEEMFFRSYLLRRLRFGGTWAPAVALVLSSAAFASLHDDRMLALGAGLVFGGLVLRSGRIGDAVIAHMVANATIAAWAVSVDDWSVI